MSFVLRPYQERAVRNVRAAWQAGKRRVCLVAPTGSGKSVMGAAIVEASGAPRTIWVAHRRELVGQAGETLRALGLDVGFFCPGFERQPDARVQVATIETLLARKLRPEANLVVLDEMHHYGTSAAEWAAFVEAYPTQPLVGLTATPERADGTSLRNVADHLVVAATYSELIAAGHLVPCQVWMPPPAHARGGLALDPVEAYQKHAAGTRAFVFFKRVAHATDYAERFSNAGIPARVVHGKTPPNERAETLAQFARGDVLVVCNVNCFTEGTDVPAATTCILAKNCGHPSIFLQMAGRVLRPYPGKAHAILIDLVDAVGEHGVPTEDRNYSLIDGQAITRAKNAGVRQCPECESWFDTTLVACPNCGWGIPVLPPPELYIWNEELRRVAARGEAFTDEHRQMEYARLRRVAKTKGFSIAWVVNQYRALFPKQPPDLSDVTEDERREEFGKLREVGLKRQFKPGFAAARYRSTFSRWPPREWVTSPPAAHPAMEALKARMGLGAPTAPPLFSDDDLVGPRLPHLEYDQEEPW